MLEIPGGTCIFTTKGAFIQYFWVKHFWQGPIFFCSRNGIKSDNSGLKSSGKTIFRNSFKSDAVAEEIFMILPDIFGSSSRHLMIFGGKILSLGKSM